jgi:hypothetical protein
MGRLRPLSSTCGAPPPDEDEQDRRRRFARDDLLLRAFHIDALVCPSRGAKRKLIAMISCLPVVRDILLCVGLDTDASSAVARRSFSEGRADPPARAPPRDPQIAFDPFPDIPA